VPGVRDVAVVGARQGSEERVHAVVVLEPNVAAKDVVREANAHLLDHQRVRGVSVWPGSELPRTEGTRKLKRREIRDWVATGTAPAGAAPRESVDAMLAVTPPDEGWRPTRRSTSWDSRRWNGSS
jgi:acyl-coenzyme A synthetase/AMP-(fatty) acid ligase